MLLSKTKSSLNTAESSNREFQDKISQLTLGLSEQKKINESLRSKNFDLDQQNKDLEKTMEYKVHDLEKTIEQI